MRGVDAGTIKITLIYRKQSPFPQGKGFSFRRPDSSVESGWGLLFPYCRIEHRNPSYGGGSLPSQSVGCASEVVITSFCCAAICFCSRHREPLLRGDLLFIFANCTRFRLPRPPQNCRLDSLPEPGLAVTVLSVIASFFCVAICLFDMENVYF